MAKAKWTDPRQAALDEGRYWLTRRVSERIAAMEEIRERVYKGYREASKRMASLGVPPLRIDIMNYIDGVPFARAYEGAIRESFSGIDLRFLGLADFVTTKLASGGTKDLLDVELLKESGLWEED